MLLHYPTRRSVGYFGAVRLRDGKLCFRRETDKFNALTCWKFLQYLKAASTRSGRRVVVITDNAKYHHARLHREWREKQRRSFRPRLPPRLQPGAEPYRAPLETHPSTMPAQPVLRASG